MENMRNKKKEIIESSYQLMHLYGYHGTSVKKITDAAGIPKGSFYNYFNNKEDYAKHVIEYFMSREAIFQMFEDSQLSAHDQITTFFKRQIEYFKTKKFKYGCFVGNLTQEMADVSPLLSEAAESFHLFVANKLEKALIRGNQSGELNLFVDEHKLSNFLINAWQGTLLRMKSNQAPQLLDEYLEVLETFLT